GRLAFLGGKGTMWRWLRPLQLRLLPADSHAKRIALGVLWGWLPCGLSTTLLVAAWLQADARNGALTMAAFGLGTLPVMLPLTWSGLRLKLWLQHGRWRIVAALLILAAGLLTMAAPWLMHVPALHDTLAALGCTPAPRGASCSGVPPLVFRRDAALRQALQLGRIEHVHVPPGHGDHGVVLQPGESAADGLDREPQVAGDVLAAHRQPELQPGLPDVREALAHPVQEQRDALVGVPPREHFRVVLVERNALPDHPQQLPLHARQLGGEGGQFVGRHLAPLGCFERDRLAAAFAFGQRIQAHQFAGRVETDHALVAAFAEAGGLERAVARDVDRRPRI